jgi:hypothetical protein
MGAAPQRIFWTRLAVDMSGQGHSFESRYPVSKVTVHFPGERVTRPSA